MKDKYNNALGCSIYAGLLFEGAQENSSNRTGLLKEVLHVTEDGLASFPNDEACATLRAKIAAELHPQDMQKRYDSSKACVLIGQNRSRSAPPLLRR